MNENYIKELLDIIETKIPEIPAHYVLLGANREAARSNIFRKAIDEYSKEAEFLPIRPTPPEEGWYMMKIGENEEVSELGRTIDGKWNFMRQPDYIAKVDEERLREIVINLKL